VNIDIQNSTMSAFSVPQGRQKIAIIGTGISGMSAAWLLHKHHDITVFEKNDYIGGHSNTVDVDLAGSEIAVDTGFIVYNPPNYPNLVELFRLLDVPTASTDMSFSVSMDEGAFEYSGTGMSGLLAQKRNILRPSFWRMVQDILKFYKHTPRYLEDEKISNMSLGEFLKAEGYSQAFVDYHMGPMGGAIWSCASKTILDYPIKSFLQFFKNHGLTQLKNRPPWKTVKGGSREYVNRLTAGFKDRIRYNCPALKVSRQDRQVLISSPKHTDEVFDHVIFACHSDQVLGMLTDASAREYETLNNFKYIPNKAVLHTDKRLMPKRKKAWASWNYLGQFKEDSSTQLQVTYWMNKLQPLATDTDVFVTLNPHIDVDPEHVLWEFDYMHPLFDMDAMSSQEKLWHLQGQNNSWFCGAYFGAGFHEDGIQSGLAVAELLSGIKRPWQVENQNQRMSIPDNIKPFLQVGSHVA